MSLEKIAAKNVTEAIAKAMEKADRMKSLVIVYEITDEVQEVEQATHGVVVPSGTTLAQVNYLLDIGKKWVFEFDDE